MKKTVIFAAGVSLLLHQAAYAAESRAVVVKPILSTTQTASGQPIVLPKANVRVVVSEFTIAVGARLPVHKHPFPRFAYVLEGKLSVTSEKTKRVSVYTRGDMIIEVIDQWHFGANTGQRPVRLLVIDQVEGDRPNTILK